MIFGICEIVLAQYEPESEISPQKLFEKALKNHKDKNYSEAEKLYLQVLNDNSELPEVLHNLGLLYYTTENSGRALGFLRSLTELEPRNAEIYKTISFIENKLANKDFEHDRSIFEDLNFIFLRWVKLPEFLILHFVLMAGFGFYFVRRLSLRKKTLLLDDKTELWTPKMYSLTITMFLVTLLTFFKIQSTYEIRATVIAKNKLTLKSGPSEKGADLYDLFEGFEVVVDSTFKEWSQITYQDRFTGWVKTNTVWKHIK
jgi:tetratricopeptide (TPR) repeat protein